MDFGELRANSLGIVLLPFPPRSCWDVGEPLEQPGALLHVGMVAPGVTGNALVMGRGN